MVEFANNESSNTSPLRGAAGLRIGLTGGIGSGKSVVAQVFKTLGIPVFDADAAAKVIMETDNALIAKIKTEFGEATYDDNKLNRTYLANIVFNNPYKLEKLNALVHPATINAANNWMQKQNAPYTIKEAALIFESGSGAGLDYIIGVTAPKSLRIKRVMDRSALQRDEVIARMERQIDDSIKMRLCDFVINNDEQNALLPQVLAIHNGLLKSPKGN